MSSHRDRSAASRELRRPDSAILNEAIPVFAIGRSQSGLWIARDCDSSAGGAFLSKAAAIRFAKHTGGACAVTFVPDGLELDGTPSSAHRSRDPKAGLRGGHCKYQNEKSAGGHKVSIPTETRRLFEACM